ncbi:hypothetical protein VdG1_04221 [Verticillium dahliae VDG1]|nr:hypothetical protein VdG1_04221 [Verticillium dahliae VDG1]
MSTATNPAPNGTADKKQKANTRKEFKILMLHGYTQSGPLFRSKTRALEKLLAKALTPLSLTLNCIYPTAPIKLNPADIPGYQPPADDAEDTPAPDSWAWFRRRDNPLDTVVDEGRSRALVDRCEEAAVVGHPGGHYVPISKEWAMALAGYVKHHAQDPEAAKM